MCQPLMCNASFHACRYDAIIHGRHTQGYITNELQQHWQNGVRVGAAAACSHIRWYRDSGLFQGLPDVHMDIPTGQAAGMAPCC
jgi:hypothetical protein